MKTPSAKEVEFAIKALEIEDEPEKEALRKFYERERSQPRAMRWWEILLLLAVVQAILMFLAAR